MFLPGEARCYAVMGIFDDPLVEADEVFDVEFGDATEGFVKIKDERLQITIIDDEPDVSWNSTSSVQTEGALSTFTLTLTEEVAFPISINV